MCTSYIFSDLVAAGEGIGGVGVAGRVGLGIRAVFGLTLAGVRELGGVRGFAELEGWLS